MSIRCGWGAWRGDEQVNYTRLLWCSNMMSQKHVRVEFWRNVSLKCGKTNQSGAVCCGQVVLVHCPRISLKNADLCWKQAVPHVVYQPFAPRFHFWAQYWFVWLRHVYRTFTEDFKETQGSRGPGYKLKRHRLALLIAGHSKEWFNYLFSFSLFLELHWNSLSLHCCVCSLLPGPTYRLKKSKIM